MANYTMYYRDYVKTYSAPRALSKLPTVTIDEEQFSFAKMFYDRQKHKEIGAETPELWGDMAERLLTEVNLIYGKKIKDWADNIGKIWERASTEEAKTEDNFYYNPTVSASEGNPKLQSTSEHIYPHHIIFNTKSNADLINAAMEIENIFYEALKYTDILFMSIY